MRKREPVQDAGRCCCWACETIIIRLVCSGSPRKASPLINVSRLLARTPEGRAFGDSILVQHEQQPARRGESATRAGVTPTESEAAASMQRRRKNERKRKRDKED